MSDAAEPVLCPVHNDEFLDDVQTVVDAVAGGGWTPDFVVGIGRGGLVPAVYISHHLDLPMLSIDHSSKVPGFADELLGTVAQKSADGTRLLFIDDINDTGGTIDYIRHLLADHGSDSANLRFAVLIDNRRSKARVDYRARTIDRDDDKRWFVFPWEAVGSRETIVEEARSVPERLGVGKHRSVPERLSIEESRSVPERLSIEEARSVPERLSIEEVRSVPERLG